jgi:hypothetical protein
MGLPRTFVGFSSTDILSYYLMMAWKEHEHIDFNFTDCQLQQALDSENEDYIKRRCRERIKMAGYYVMLIGKDTHSKHKYVRWEAEVAIEKHCTIIDVNLDHWRYINSNTCPSVIRDIGALFVPFSPHIIAHALKNFRRQTEGNRYYPDEVYRNLGYNIQGDTARWPPPANPFLVRSILRKF